MYLNIAINLNNDYNPMFKDEPFKYQIVVLNSKVIFSVNPGMIKDIF